MRQKIDGHIYDTSTARKIGDTHCGPDDIGWYNNRMLYMTRSGNYFFYDEDYVPFTKHKHEEIIPITKERAEQWLKENPEATEE